VGLWVATSDFLENEFVTVEAGTAGDNRVTFEYRFATGKYNREFEWLELKNRLSLSRSRKLEFFLRER